MRGILLGLTVVMIGLNGSARADVKTLTVTVDGLACPFCAYGLEKKLKRVEGVDSLKIDVDAGEAVINISPGTRLVAPSGEEKGVSGGLVMQVQEAVEEAGFTPRALYAAVVGNIVHESGRARLELAGTGESLVFDESSNMDELQRFGGDDAVHVAGTLDPETSPLRLTLERVSLSQSPGTVCRLKISGMICTGCVEAIQTSLQEQEGVLRTQIDLESGLAEIVVEDGHWSEETLAAMVNNLEMEGMPAGTFKATVLEE